MRADPLTGLSPTNMHAQSRVSGPAPLWRWVGAWELGEKRSASFAWRHVDGAEHARTARASDSRQVAGQA